MSNLNKYIKKGTTPFLIDNFKENKVIERVKTTISPPIHYDLIGSKEILRKGKDYSNSLFNSKFKIK